MLSNQTKDVSIKKAHQSLADRMAAYDELDPELRKLLQEAPYKMSPAPKWRSLKPTKADIASLRRRIAEIKAESATLAYGPNHPEAKVG